MNASDDNPLRPPVTPGAYRVGLAVGYTPYGEEGSFVDSIGKVNRWAQVIRKSEIAANASYTFSEFVYAQIEARYSVLDQRNALDKDGVLQLERVVNNAWSTVGEVRLSLPQKGEFYPQFSLLAGVPWSVGTAVTLGVINDPVVLQGAVQYLASLTRHDAVLTVSGRAGLVVNDSTGLICGVRHTIPLSELQVPSTTVTLGVTYSLPSNEQDKISFLTNPQTVGSQQRTGFMVKVDHSVGQGSL